MRIGLSAKAHFASSSSMPVVPSVMWNIWPEDAVVPNELAEQRRIGTACGVMRYATFSSGDELAEEIATREGRRRSRHSLTTPAALIGPLTRQDLNRVHQ